MWVNLVRFASGYGNLGAYRDSPCRKDHCSDSSRHESVPGYRANMDTLYLWRWYLPDIKGRLRPSGWRMTGAEAQKRHPGCTKVDGTLETRRFERVTDHTFASGLVRREDGAMMPPEPFQRSGPSGCPLMSPCGGPLTRSRGDEIPGRWLCCATAYGASAL
jgi:hypothetical protein